MKNILVNDNYGNVLNVCVWDQVSQVKGVFQIMHGLNEHGERYNEFATFLNKNGYIVYLGEHVSQGKSRTEKDKDIVDFGRKGNLVLVDGMHMVFKKIIFDYPETDVFLFGHSLGTLITRNYLFVHHNKYKKIIMNGAGLANVKGIGVMITLGTLRSFFGNGPSDLFDGILRKTQLSLKDKIEMDHFIEWLTRDEEYNKLNLEDKLLYIRLSTRGYTSLFKLVKKANNINLIKKKYKPSIDVLLLSGTHDPSTDYGESAKKLNELFIENGIKSQVKLYHEGRHDSLQEINRKEVFEDILNFVKD